MAELIQEDAIDELTLPKKAETENKPNRDYVNNKRLSQVLKVWKQEYDKCKSEGLELPRIPEEVGLATMKIATSYARRYNFSGYSYKDEMILDALEHVCRYIHNFNPEAKTKSGSPNAFSYITNIVHNTFTRRIQIEHKNQYVKYKSFELAGGMEVFQNENPADIGDDVGSVLSSCGIADDFMDKVYEYEEKYGLGKKEEKEVGVPTVEDDFMFQFMV